MGNVRGTHFMGNVQKSFITDTIGAKFVIQVISNHADNINHLRERMMADNVISFPQGIANGWLPTRPREDGEFHIAFPPVCRS